MITAIFRPRLWPLYLLYTVILSGLLLYARFPERDFAQFCARFLAQHLPNHITTTGAIGYRFPLTLIVDKMQITPKNKPGEPLVFDQVRLTARIPHLLSRFDISLSAYQGSARARLVRDSQSDGYRLEGMDIQNMDLAALALLRTRTGRTITGRFSARGNYSGHWGQHPLAGSGEGALELRNGSIELLTPLLSLKSISVEQSVFPIKLDKQQIAIGKGEFSGQEIKGEITGKLAGLTSEAGAIQLELTGKLTPTPALIQKSGSGPLRKLPPNQALPFHLKGTIGKPVFLFDSFQG